MRARLSTFLRRRRAIRAEQRRYRREYTARRAAVRARRAAS